MFEILEHTADIGFRAWGRSREEMFENAALALESVALDVEEVEPRTVYPIAATGDDEASLLVNWLSEVLFYLDGRRVAMRRFRVDLLTSSQIVGQGWGEPRESERPRPKLVVKGVTYHQLTIARTKDGWSADVYLDI